MDLRSLVSLVYVRVVLSAALPLVMLETACGAPENPEAASDGSAGVAASAELVAQPPTESVAQPAAAAVAKRVPIVQQLRAASAGLLFMSESDYPFEVFSWKAPGGHPDADRVAALSGHSGELVEEKSLVDFFRNATTPQPWQSPEELATVQRYQALVKLLRKDLSFIRVFRFGKIQIHSYVVGVSSGGTWVGLSTVQIET